MREFADIDEQRKPFSKSCCVLAAAALVLVVTRLDRGWVGLALVSKHGTDIWE